jgi:hypothetical protein
MCAYLWVYACVCVCVCAPASVCVCVCASLCVHGSVCACLTLAVLDGTVGCWRRYRTACRVQSRARPPQRVPQPPWPTRTLHPSLPPSGLPLSPSPVGTRPFSPRPPMPTSACVHVDLCMYACMYVCVCVSHACPCSVASAQPGPLCPRLGAAEGTSLAGRAHKQAAAAAAHFLAAQLAAEPSLWASAHRATLEDQMTSLFRALGVYSSPPVMHMRMAGHRPISLYLSLCLALLCGRRHTATDSKGGRGALCRAVPGVCGGVATAAIAVGGGGCAAAGALRVAAAALGAWGPRPCCVARDRARRRGPGRASRAASPPLGRTYPHCLCPVRSRVHPCVGLAPLTLLCCM